MTATAQRGSPRKATTWRARMAALTLVATMGVVASGFATASPASAGVANPGFSGWSYTGNQAALLGVEVSYGQGLIGYCSKDTQSGPYSTRGADFVYTNRQTINAGEAYVADPATARGNIAGQGIVGGNTGTVAYLIDRWAGESAGNESTAMNSHYAINDLSIDGAFQNSSYVDLGTVNSMTQDARTFAGPYVIDPTIVLSQDGRSATIGDIGIQTASGALLPGHNITLTVTGPGVFSNGTDTITVPSAGSYTSEVLTSTGNGPLHVTATATDLPATSFVVLRDELAQDIFIAGPKAQASGATDPVAMVFDFQPSATTKVTTQYVKPGDQVTDQVIPAGDGWTIIDGAYVPVTFEGTLYGPFTAPQEQQATVPAGAPVVGTTTLTFNGPTADGLTSEPLTVTDAGFYTWVWTMTKANQPEQYQPYIRSDFVSPFFEHQESNIARTPVTITSQIDPQDVLSFPGDPVQDTVTFSGFPADHGALGKIGDFQADQTQATHIAYGPFEAKPNADTNPVDIATAPVAGQITTPASEGDVKALFEGAAAPKQPGWYVVVTKYAGDDRVQPAESSIYDEAEMFQVGQLPTAVTQAQPDAVIGAPIVDNVTVTDINGLIAEDTAGTWSVQFKAYYAGDLPPLKVDENGKVIGEVTPEIAAICTGEPFFTSRISIKAAGTYPSEATTYDKAGNVFWVESLIREVNGEVNYQTEGVCGLPNETTKIAETPVAVTQATEAALVGVDKIEDTATVTDPTDTLALPGYRWYLVFNAYGPTAVAPLQLDADGKPVLEDGQVPSDIAQVCQADPFYTSPEVAVTGAGDYKSGSTDVTGAGNVFWSEDLYAVPVNPDNGQDAGSAILMSKGVCGLPNETTKTLPVPDVVTQATPAIKVGESAQDTATVTDTDGAITSGYWKFEIQFNAFGPMNGQAVCDGTPFFTSERVAVSAAGQYVSGQTPNVDKAGSLYWVEDLYATPINPKTGEVTGEQVLVHKGECGLPNETTTVSALPSGNNGGAGAGGGLASTGVQVGGMIAAIVALVGAGAALSYKARRRNEQA